MRSFILLFAASSVAADGSYSSYDTDYTMDATVDTEYGTDVDVEWPADDSDSYTYGASDFSIQLAFYNDHPSTSLVLKEVTSDSHKEDELSFSGALAPQSWETMTLSSTMSLSAKFYFAAEDDDADSQNILFVTADFASADELSSSVTFVSPDGEFEFSYNSTQVYYADVDAASYSYGSSGVENLGVLTIVASAPDVTSYGSYSYDSYDDDFDVDTDSGFTDSSDSY